MLFFFLIGLPNSTETGVEAWLIRQISTYTGVEAWLVRWICTITWVEGWLITWNHIFVGVEVEAW